MNEILLLMRTYVEKRNIEELGIKLHITPSGKGIVTDDSEYETYFRFYSIDDLIQNLKDEN